jgi:hypothetical protein
MAQQQFNPTPGVSTNADCEGVINANATDAESRLSSLQTSQNTQDAAILDLTNSLNELLNPPSIRWRITNAPTADDVLFPIDNVVAANGFTGGQTTASFTAPKDGQYLLLFNASLQWTESDSSLQAMSISVRRNSTQVCAQTIYRAQGTPSSTFIPVNLGFRISLTSGDTLNLSPRLAQTATAATQSNETNECSLTWISP